MREINLNQISSKKGESGAKASGEPLKFEFPLEFTDETQEADNTTE